MFPFLSSPKKRIVNLIINDHSIRYLDLKQANPTLSYKWGERFLPSGIVSNGKIIELETLSAILEDCVNEWKLRNRQVRFLIPESFVIIRKVSIPADVEDDEIKGYLYLEIGASIHLPFDEPIFDAVVLSKEREKKELLIFAAQEESVTEYAELLSNAKLKPIAAEVSPLAVYRLYYHLDQHRSEEDILVVNFDLNAVNICIFERTFPFFMHHLPIDFDEKNWNIRTTRKGNYELTYSGEQNDLIFLFDDVYKEVSRIIDFYRYSLHQGKKRISKVLLNGDHPMIGKVKKDLQSRLEMPIETLALDDLNAEGSLPPSHYLALGLALKGVQT